LYTVEISKKVIEHIVKRHGDWVEMLELKSEVEIRSFIAQILSQPYEVYKDKVRDNVRYFLRELDDKFYV